MASVKAAHVAAAGKRYVVPLASSAQMPRMQRSQKKSDRAEGQPVGEMNSPQGGRAGLFLQSNAYGSVGAALAIGFRE